MSPLVVASSNFARAARCAPVIALLLGLERGFGAPAPGSGARRSATPAARTDAVDRSQFIASSNSGTNRPGWSQPRSPPLRRAAVFRVSRASASKVAVPQDLAEVRPTALRRLRVDCCGWAAAGCARGLCDAEGVALALSTSLAGGMPAPVRSSSGATSSGNRPRTASTNTSGRRSALAQADQRRPPRRLPSSDSSRAHRSKSSPARPRLRRLRRARGGSVAITRRRAVSGTATRIWAMLYSAGGAAARRSSMKTVDLGVGDGCAVTGSRSRTRSVSSIWSRTLLAEAA